MFYHKTHRFNNIQVLNNLISQKYKFHKVPSPELITIRYINFKFYELSEFRLCYRY